MAKYLCKIDVRYSLSDPFDGAHESVKCAISEAITLYDYLIPKFKIATNGVSKVILFIGAAHDRATKLVDIITYEHSYHNDPENVGRNSESSVQAFFVHEITLALINLGKKFGWDASQIYALKEEMERRNYKFYGVALKPKLNKSRATAVGVEWRTKKAIEIGFNVTKKSNGEQNWVHIVNVGFNLGPLDSIPGQLSWMTDANVRLWNKNKRDYWDLDTLSLETIFHYAPAEEGNPHGQYQLARMYLSGEGYTVDRDTRKGMEWLRKSAQQGFGRAVKLLNEISDGNSHNIATTKQTQSDM